MFPELRPSPEGHSRPTSCMLKAMNSPHWAQPLKKPTVGDGGGGIQCRTPGHKAKAQGRQLRCCAGPTATRTTSEGE